MIVIYLGLILTHFAGKEKKGIKLAGAKELLRMQSEKAVLLLLT